MVRRAPRIACSIDGKMASPLSRVSIRFPPTTLAPRAMPMARRKSGSSTEYFRGILRSTRCAPAVRLRRTTPASRVTRTLAPTTSATRPGVTGLPGALLPGFPGLPRGVTRRHDRAGGDRARGDPRGPGSLGFRDRGLERLGRFRRAGPQARLARLDGLRSEEHTSELQSPCNLVCRLPLER